MIRAIALTVSLLSMALTTRAADEAKGEKVEYSTYSDYFLKNTSGVKGEATYLVFTDKDGYDKAFSLRPPLMGGKKSVALPGDAFEKKIVVAAIKQGNAITTYDIVKVSVDGDTLFVQYKATAGKASTATFTSPLIVSVEKGKLKKVTFIENEKTVSTVDVK